MGIETHQCDVAIVGAGLAGLVAACAAADRGRAVLIVDLEGAQSLGGQAFWSLGGLSWSTRLNSAAWASATTAIWPAGLRCRPKASS
ncbi:MAG: succinate dehydrogenase/fumarate reductase flavoprotein subunit [Paracoccaceae bacterium]|jgi:succinate dehydrogenase/fumarate reductase flavoprotein subunit